MATLTIWTLTAVFYAGTVTLAVSGDDKIIIPGSLIKVIIVIIFLIAGAISSVWAFYRRQRAGEKRRLERLERMKAEKRKYFPDNE